MDPNFIHVYYVVELRNGKFWSLHYPMGQSRIHACMTWGPGATKDKIKRDVEVLCKQRGIDPPTDFQIRTVHAQIVGTDV